MLELPPLGLYVHIPWCVRKCPYCDFNSHEHSGALPQQEYVEALLADLDQECEWIPIRPLQSIFIGGGTPSLFDAASYEKLLAGVQNRLGFNKDIEITLEANPGSIEADRFRDYRATGINRLSLGVQSFADDQLVRLGRIHSADRARAALVEAAAAGFDNFNIDLMHGLPEQSAEEALADLETALAFEPSHVSWYQLTIEPNTVFYNRPPNLPAEELICASQDSGLQALLAAGLERYEVSAFARPGREAKHNLNYWQFGDYLGIGAGAHGKLTLPETDAILRTQKKRQPNAYLNDAAQQAGRKKRLTHEDRSVEFLLNGLRLKQGFSESLFSRRTGLPFDQIAKQVESLINRGLLQRQQGNIRCSDHGYRLLNTVLEEFI